MTTEFGTIRPAMRDGVLVIEVLDRRLVEPDHVQRLGAEMQTAIRDSALPAFVIDFSAVEFLSSAMLTVLIAVNATARDHGGALAVASLNKDLRKMFKMIRMDSTMHIFKDVNAAVEALG